MNLKGVEKIVQTTGLSIKKETLMTTFNSFKLTF